MSSTTLPAGQEDEYPLAAATHARRAPIEGCVVQRVAVVANPESYDENALDEQLHDQDSYSDKFALTTSRPLNRPALKFKKLRATWP